MGNKFTEVGGGPAMGLANDFTGMLRSLMHGNFGGQPSAGQRFNAADPVGSTQGIMGILQGILSPGGGTHGGAITDMIKQESERDVANLHASYGAGGGSSMGTPAAYGEAVYRAEAAPRAATAVGNLQLSAIQPLLQMIYGTANKGITQRQTVAEPNPLVSILSGLAPAAGAAASGPIGAALFNRAPGIPNAPDLSGFLRDFNPMDIPIPRFN